MIDNPSSNELPFRKHPAHGLLLRNGQPTIVFDTVGSAGVA